MEVILTNAYFIVAAVLFLEMSASWDVYGRYDISSWCVGCLAVSLLNVFVVSSRNAKRKKRKVDSQTYER